MKKIYVAPALEDIVLTEAEEILDISGFDSALDNDTPISGDDILGREDASLWED